MNYILRDNTTGEEYMQAFKPSDFNSILPNVAPVVAEGADPTVEQASKLLAIWNCAQSNYKREFSYRLA